MKKIHKRRKSGNPVMLLLVFAVFTAIMIITLKILFTSPTFTLVDTAYAGNGIYNTFFMNGTGAVGTDIPVPLPAPEAETAVAEEIIDMFGKVSYSSNAVLITGNGTVVSDLDKDRVVFPASLTKVMTAVVVLERVGDLSQKIVMDADIFEIAAAENAAIAGFMTGEEVTILDLLYGSLLASGADATLALARYVSATENEPGSEEAFSLLMNEKAAELGLNDTHFVNASGLHNPKHYSTAHDMARLFAYAIKNETFRRIVTSEEYITAPSNMHAEGLKIQSSVRSVFKKAGLEMYPVLGGKTGYTPEAKLCLASFATIDYNGVPTDFILVTLGAGDGTYKTQYHAMDAHEVFRIAAPQPEELIINSAETSAAP
ncbi:MAG: serine hydrolase [Eubacteriales bacterium]|jgi:D-alanyl-D-alanine carboxypeptidase (penicillin-binding protein 5/6)|nr:serine hydrolase [Eubacteriales bacterium]